MRVYEDDHGRTSDSHWPQTLRWKSGLIERHVPLWIVCGSAAFGAAVVSPKRRFGLKTMLIATTIVCVAIGLAAIDWRPDDWQPDAGGGGHF